MWSAATPPEELREFSLLVQPLCSYAEDMTADELVETKMVLEWTRLLERTERDAIWRSVNLIEG